MKTSLSLLALALTVTSAFAAPQDVTSPTPTTRPPPDTIIGPIRPTATFAPPDTCSCPGPVLCCIEIVDSTSATGQKILELLGYAIKGPQGFPVGVSCWHACAPGQLCPAVVCTNPVCCLESSDPPVGAVGCMKVPGITPPYPTAVPL